MQLSSVFVLLFIIITARTLTCEEDIRCCQIIKAQEINEKLTSKLLRWIPWTKETSHHSLLLTLEDGNTRIIELGGDNQKSLKCSIERADSDRYVSGRKKSLKMA